MNEDIDTMLFSGQGNWSFSSPIKELVETLRILRNESIEELDPHILGGVLSLLSNEIGLQLAIQQDAITSYKAEKAKQKKATITSIKK